MECFPCCKHLCREIVRASSPYISYPTWSYKRLRSRTKIS